MKKDRILISISTLEVGGAQTFALALASKLNELGCHITFFVWNEQKVVKSMRDELLNPNVNYLDMQSFPILNFISWKLSALFQVFETGDTIRSFFKARLFRFLIWKLRIQIVHSFLFPSDYLCARLVPKTVKLVITEEGDYLLRKRKNEIIPTSIINRADKWVAVSSFARVALADLIKVPLEKIALIYNAMPFKEQISSSRNNGGFVVGMVARGHYQKGWSQLIKAFKNAQAINPEIKQLRLVGDGEAIDELSSCYSNDSSIQFLGYCQNPSEIISSFDIGVLPSYFEGETFGISVLEYLKHGKPAIVSNWGGLPEVIERNGIFAGQVIPMNEAGEPDEEALCQAILKYSVEHDFYDEHVKNIPTVIERFDSLTIAKQYTEQYAGLLT